MGEDSRPPFLVEGAGWKVELRQRELDVAGTVREA